MLIKTSSMLLAIGLAVATAFQVPSQLHGPRASRDLQPHPYDAADAFPSLSIVQQHAKPVSSTELRLASESPMEDGHKATSAVASSSGPGEPAASSDTSKKTAASEDSKPAFVSEPAAIETPTDALVSSSSSSDGADALLGEVGAIIKSVTGGFSSENLDLDIIKANIMDREVGERGEASTALQLLLMFCILTAGVPVFNDFFILAGGPGLMLGGGAMIVASLSDLGSTNLTPFPVPTTQGSLVTDGLYSKIRHPTYTGLIALSTGFSIATGSASRLLLTGLLIYLLDIKTSKEEDELAKKFPEYAAYKESVSGKFLPSLDEYQS